MISKDLSVFLLEIFCWIFWEQQPKITNGLKFKEKHTQKIQKDKWKIKVTHVFPIFSFPVLLVGSFQILIWINFSDMNESLHF